MQEPEVRIKNRHYSYTKTYESLSAGIHELVELVPSIGTRIFPEYFNVLEKTAIMEDYNIELTKTIFQNCINILMNDFPTIYDEAFPATLALSITGDRFYFRFKDKTAIMWDYDSESLRNGDKILIHLTIQFTESGNKLISNKLTQTIKKLKDYGYTYIDDKELRERRSPRLKNQNYSTNQSSKDFDQFNIESQNT